MAKPFGNAVASGDPEKARILTDALSLGLVAFLVFEYLRPGDYLPGLDHLKLNSLIPIGIFVLALATKRGRPLSSIFAASSSKWLAWLVALFVIQFLVADVRLYVYEKFRIVAGYLLIYFVIIRHVVSVARVRFIFATLVLVHVALVALHPSVVLDPTARHYIGGTFLSDGNDFSWSACIVVPYAVCLARNANRRLVRWSFGGVTVLLVLAVVGTQSRGGTLALAAVATYLALRSRRRIAVFGGLVVLALALLSFAPAEYFERMGTISQYADDGSAQGRIIAWRAASRMASDRPLAGVGPGHFSVMFGHKYKPHDYVGPYLNAHSIYFMMLGEFGFPGLFVLCGILVANAMRNERALARITAFSPAERLDRQRDLLVAIQAALIAYAVAGAFLSGIYYPHLFILAALSEGTRYAILRQYPKRSRARLSDPRQTLRGGGTAGRAAIGHYRPPR